MPRTKVKDKVDVTVSAAAFRLAREMAGLTQEQCAELLHCTSRSVANWESGERKVHLASYELLLRKTRLTNELLDFLHDIEHAHKIQAML